MTIDEMINVIHKTIYGFFDVCGDGEPMSDKDELLLEVNKAICNNLKALEKELSGDVISRQAVLDAIDDIDKTACMNEYHAIVRAIDDLPSVKPQYTDAEIQKMQALEQAEIQKAYELGKPKTGRWIYDRRRDWDGECAYECSECGMGSDDDHDYCPNCGAKMESEEQA